MVLSLAHSVWYTTNRNVCTNLKDLELRWRNRRVVAKEVCELRFMLTNYFFYLIVAVFHLLKKLSNFSAGFGEAYVVVSLTS